MVDDLDDSYMSYTAQDLLRHDSPTSSGFRYAFAGILEQAALDTRDPDSKRRFEKLAAIAEGASFEINVQYLITSAQGIAVKLVHRATNGPTQHSRINEILNGELQPLLNVSDDQASGWSAPSFQQLSLAKVFALAGHGCRAIAEIAAARSTDPVIAIAYSDEELEWAVTVERLASIAAALSMVLVPLLAKDDHNDSGDPSGSEPARPATLTADQAAQYVGALEGFLKAVTDARTEGLLDPAQEEGVINLMKQFELAWHRSTVRPKQLEDLIGELLEILNGAVDDETKFRDEFIRLGAEPHTASVLSHRLAMAIAKARAGLGTEDPVHAAATVKETAEVAEEVAEVEKTLRRRWIENAVDASGKTVGNAGTLTAGATGLAAGGWAIKELGTRVATEFVGAMFKLWHLFYGG